MHDDEVASEIDNLVDTVGNRTAALVPPVTNGSVPLTVVFGLDIEDPGNVTAWAMDFGDNVTDGRALLPGDLLPPSVNHTYEVVGLFNATLKVEYVDGGTANATVLIEALPGGPAVGTFLRIEEFDASGTILVGAQTTACGTGVNAGPDYAWEFVVAGEDGIPNVVTHVDIALSSSGPGAVDIDLEFRGPGGFIASSTSSGPNEEISVDGEFAPGTYTIDVDGCIAINAAVTVHAEATYVVAAV